MYCNIYNKHVKSKKNKKINLPIVYSKCGHEYEEIFKEEELYEILNALG